ncbi:hypothetical protein LC613_32225 [Nostoc sphaeroides CHAB 2801]|uniref:hypothetical protein n=1 Tax=Nostoc sphaeroides TaxID=446679 RepID=UPI001E410E92|nr:hypothetical protein [Nostoc sphaeroides]MCC5632306.1 hypothetical protein [Nostoc sphaeroides CHAB 2801]
MTSQLNISNNKTRKEASPLSDIPTHAMFESHPFIVQSKSDHQLEKPDLKTSLIQAQKYGHSLGKTNSANQSDSTVVQPKLDNQPVQFARGKKRPVSSSAKENPTKKTKPERRQLDERQFIKDFTSQNADRADAVLSGRGESFIPKLGLHVTPTRNVNSIRQTGLDPNRGGRGGASEAAGEAQFIKNSQGRIHYSDRPSTSAFYSGFMGGRNQTTLLGIKNQNRRSLETDPDDPRRAFRTSQLIPPSDITTLNPRLMNRFSQPNYNIERE